jgi:hypothetical protein
MKAIVRAVLASAVALGVCATMERAQAACPPPGPLIQTGRARIVSNPYWCFTLYGCYGVAPVSSSLDGFFWGQTGASGARNAGVDSGGFLIGSWTESRRPVYAYSGHGWYYYNVYLADPAYGSPGIPISWDHQGIDGCISAITPSTNFDECTCMVLTDSWNGVGYMAILSAKADPQGNFNLLNTVNGLITLGQIPRPVVTNTARDPATGDVTFTVAVTTPLGSQACDCGIGFRVYEQVLPAGSPPPIDRRACTQETLFRSTGQSIAPNDPSFIDACKAAGFGWVPALDASGATQSLIPFSAVTPPARVKVPCLDIENTYDIYLAASIGTNEGPGQIQFTHVGPNSFIVQCGSTLAEPSRPRKPEAPGQSGGDRHSRGGRER